MKQRVGHFQSMIPRSAVYAAVDGERDYQDSKWNPTTTQTGGHHTPTEWLVYLQDYVSEAMTIATREADPAASTKIMHNIRKIAGMAVAAMEQHGAPRRIIPHSLA